MGALHAQEIADLGVDIRVAMAWHLGSNHYPPVPLSMIDPCIEAIDNVNDGETDELVPLPDGILYRGEDTAPSWAIVEQHHLGAWIDDEFDAFDDYEDES